DSLRTPQRRNLMANVRPPREMVTIDALRAEQREAWQRGEPILLEALLRQHPNVTLSDDELLELILGEVQLRRQSGDCPMDGGYVARFPALKEQLLHALTMQRALDKPGTDESVLSTSSLALPATDAAVPDSAPMTTPNPTAGTTQEITSLDVGSTVLSYRLVQKLSDSERGTVWRARHIKLDKDVVLNLLPRR